MYKSAKITSNKCKHDKLHNFSSKAFVVAKPLFKTWYKHSSIIHLENSIPKPTKNKRKHLVPILDTRHDHHKTERNGISRYYKSGDALSADEAQKEIEDYITLLTKNSDEVFPTIRDFNNIPLPRWPSECEVLEEKISHIYYVPPLPEPYYTSTKKEQRPIPYDSKRGKIVYQYPFPNTSNFHSSSFNGKDSQTSTVNTQENSLKFESRFESGNLAKAVKISDVYYELYLRKDLYSSKQKQWFYFRITNMKKNIMYRFSIVNVSKEENLYKDGMKPLMYSKKFANWNSIGWRRCGENITFFQKEQGIDDPDQNMTYTLTFSVQFPYDDDTVYLAYSYPYTYSDLQNHLCHISKDLRKSSYTKLRLLCRTLAGNNVYYVTITAPSLTLDSVTKSEPNNRVDKNKSFLKYDKPKQSCENTETRINQKKSIIITARINPGETPSSWMMKGFLDFLTGPSTAAAKLREKFIFKLIPMVNPDGVIVGNTKCSLTGKDLCEEFKNTVRKKFPSIWHTKLLVERAVKRGGVAMYCDLHAQYTTHNIFIDSCINPKCRKSLEAQIFPLMLHKNAIDKFSFDCCKFTSDKYNEGSPRSVLSALGVLDSITMEASFGGSMLSNRNRTHFTIADYEQIAYSFCQTLLDYYDENLTHELMLNNLNLTKQSSQDKCFMHCLKTNTDKEETSVNDYKELIKKSSKEIFPVVRDLRSMIEKPKWPTECQVLNERVKHIYYVPSTPEPYYVQTGKELKPKPLGDKRGKLVYIYPSLSISNFLTSKTNPGYNSIINNTLQDVESLRFESRFESGNLAKAVKINDEYYELYVRNDLYTSRQKQWFYFRISNMKTGISYRFSIVNLTREETLYKQGMKPLMYSKIDASRNQIGWRRCGENIAYFFNDGLLNRHQLNTYTLTFTLEFPNNDDEVYLAYCYPYTYTDLQDYLIELTKNPMTSMYVTLRTLCKTLAGNSLYYVVVTSPERKPQYSPTNSRYKEKIKERTNSKKAIIITARVHPAETPSSWMMKGVLDFITSNSSIAKELRKRFIFKLVPMLNPDGVIVGNTRCSLVGVDLNREFKHGLPKKFPTVWFTKLMIQKTVNDCGVALYCDLHSQYALNNIFIYGCDYKRGLDKLLEAQNFILLLHKKASDKLMDTSKKLTMDSSNQEVATKEPDYGLVKALQEILFPVITIPSNITTSGGFLMNYMLKSSCLDETESSESVELLRKDSKELFQVIKEPSTAIQPARWPIECQVLDEKIQHVYYVPSTPESYYVPTGKEVQPKPVGDEFGIIVYQYFPISAANYFCRSSVNGSRYLFSTCPAPEEESLKFESRFESGNLAKAIRITAIYYELYLRTDLYTNKHMQWYYFKVTKMKKNVIYRFSIVNMTKDASLYNEGMKPLLYSKKDERLHNIGWRRCGDNITYFCNDNVGPEDTDQVMTYTLTFTLEFPHDNDEVYLAYCYPYTYTDLQDYLLELSSHPIKSTFTTLRLLCKSLAGNNLYYVTITAPTENEDLKKKKAIVVTARVHPGETPASWMMKGLLDFLTSDSTPAKELREKFIFKIVPMLNPDGVIVGNTRCSLTGRDLNRQYRTVIRETYPSIWYTKLMIKRMLDECGVAMYCDLHAHSRKHSIFIYGCENRRGLDKRLEEQVFPLMLHKNAADKFAFESCKFRIHKSKEGTGRVVMWMMGIPNSFTIEASFGGSLLGNRSETHFTVQDYEQMGRSFCQTLLDFYDDDPRKKRLRNKIIDRLLAEGSSANDPTNIPLSDYSSDDGDTSSSTSDEVEKHSCSVLLTVPPPSPAVRKKRSVKTAHPKLKQTVTKEPRKTFPVSNIEVTLPLEKKTLVKHRHSSYSSSSSESEQNLYYETKVTCKQKTKKRTKKKSQFKGCYDTISRKPTKSISVLDLLPVGKPRSESWYRSAHLSKATHDVKTGRTITQQLSEVHSRLTSLTNKVWFSIGDSHTNLPLSWGQTKISEIDKVANKKSANIKTTGKTTCKQEKADKKHEKGISLKDDTREKPSKKKHNGYKTITLQFSKNSDDKL
ncbi:hypothetical protein RN001_002938 [Aquatica leii]|uniref:Peptidase M14 domain-containing protein n=1 Tax=Aquatica leii TaxID=1421715 RepID=A0AAN7SKF8_9COLE|nr:hypothetical protein RN001_002938 [Aquatica leii]